MKCCIHLYMDSANYNLEHNCRRGEDWGKEGLETEEKGKGIARRYLLNLSRASQAQQQGESSQGVVAER